MFSTSRMLYGLAMDGDAPGKFGALSRRAVPSNGLIFSCVCLTGGALVIYLVPNMLDAFTLITTVSALLFMFVWSIILLSYLAYRKQRDPLHQASKYKMPGGTVMCRVCLAFFAFILALLALEADTRMALYLVPVWFAVLGLAYRSIRQKKQATAQLSFDAD
ncbi:D-serine/D-alanine/glycine transporter [Pseudomonas putida NBRC 14164]|uniref:D-serine/D-alanine/glycine transporter n=1 Tax=Pseudomonas putida NBRC 14164 TaxID=1211579 RepID=A0ABN5UMD8_PSEPU|nr:D-serine/D-alanine/glycine transporter [Pseudomonas putida NBRC 14164]